MNRGYFPYFMLSLSIFFVDQSTKYFVRTSMAPLDVIHVLPVLNLVHVRNVGSAFGLFRSLGNTFFIVVAACASLFIALLIVKDRSNGTAFSLILGGALGNLADRIMYGHVVDFLDLHAGRYHWPAFNIADSALTAGITLLLVQSAAEVWRARRHE
ncbi:MAG: signal peptidase II [Candidatus Sulfobium sp.]